MLGRDARVQDCVINLFVAFIFLEHSIGPYMSDDGMSEISSSAGMPPGKFIVTYDYYSNYPWLIGGNFMWFKVWHAPQSNVHVPCTCI